jgi:hypothetical protein
MSVATIPVAFTIRPNDSNHKKNAHYRFWAERENTIQFLKLLETRAPGRLNMRTGFNAQKGAVWFCHAQIGWENGRVLGVRMAIFRDSKKLSFHAPVKSPLHTYAKEVYRRNPMGAQIVGTYLVSPTSDGDVVKLPISLTAAE